MRLSILILSLLFLLSFNFISSDNCDGCFYGNVCYEYGQVISANSVQGIFEDKYCDYLTDNLLVQKNLESTCDNDFECKGDYKCLSGKCSDEHEDFISEYNQLVANLTNKSFCIDLGMFCYNTSLNAPLNSTLLVNNTCNEGTTCYKCNGNLRWNETLGMCITQICGSSPGCLNITSLNNSSINSDYCSVGKCFACDDDFDWNVTSQSCQMKKCTTSVGCLNQTNLSNGEIKENRVCALGNCFICKPGYKWENSSKACVPTSSVISNSNDWTTIAFSQYDLDVGTEKLLRAYDRLQFSFEGRNYYLSVISLLPSQNRINYKIEPVLNNLVAFVGSETKFDLNSDSKLDVSVNLVSFEQNKAKVKLLAIREVVQNSTQNNPDPINNPLNPAVEDVSEEGLSKNMIYLVILLVVLIIVIIIVIIYSFASRKTYSYASTTTNASTNVSNTRPPINPQNPNYRPNN